MDKLLVVDDDETTLALVSKYLSKSGYEIISESNGKRAFDTLKEDFDSIKLIITDVVMPVMDGVEFCRLVKSDDELKNIPILMLTSMGDISDKFMGYDAGTDDYLTKPFELLELLLRVQALIRRNKNDSKESISDNNIDKIKIDKGAYSVNIRGDDIYLTSVEFDILYHLYLNENKPVSVEEVLQEVMGYPPKTGNPEIIRTHIKNIRAKLELNTSSPEIIITVPKRGYMFNNK